MAEDLLTQASDALVAVLAANAALSGYNWQRWESDAAVVQPRGYVNASSESALVYGDTPIMLTFEVVLEGKPLRGSLSAAMAELQALLSSILLPGLLQAQITDGSILFNWRAENIRITQEIQGDLRVRKITILLPLVYLWKYTP